MPAIRRRPSQTTVIEPVPSDELGLEGRHPAARAQRHGAQGAAQPDPLAVGRLADLVEAVLGVRLAQVAGVLVGACWPTG